MVGIVWMVGMVCNVWYVYDMVGIVWMVGMYVSMLGMVCLI